MLHFSSLGYYALPQLPLGYIVPRWLCTELTIFAGGLYLDFEGYQSVERFLHLAGSNSGAPDAASGLSVENPIDFTRDWLALRRKGQDITHTPLGHLCNGRRLHQAHRFFVAPGSDVQQRGVFQERDQSDSEVDGEMMI